MLPRQNRVTKNLFKEVFASGKRFRGESLSLTYAPHATDIRCAVVVSKKVEKQAVKRNMLRRKVKSCLIPLLPSLTKGIYIFFIQKNINSLSHEEIHTEVVELTSSVSS